jgi:16S rRNA (uracil1498-N3)-methyltransferase
MPRFYCPTPLLEGASIELPSVAARHVQVLRMQPGHSLTLFNGEGGEFDAQIAHMGRSDVRVTVGQHLAIERETSRQVHLAVGMPANDRMDWLVEKATELGVARITPLMTERSVMRLNGERADKKQAHWQAIAASACEQCGRNRVPRIDAPQRLDAWMGTANSAVAHKAVLSLHDSTRDLQEWAMDSEQALANQRNWLLLNGPEGGLSDAEDALARANGFAAIGLGHRILRAETAALAGLMGLVLV